MAITDPAFIERMLADPEFRRELEEEDRRKWETFTLRLLAWDGESEELPNLDRLADRRERPMHGIPTINSQPIIKPPAGGNVAADRSILVSSPLEFL